MLEAEQITETADQLAELFVHDGIMADPAEQERTLLRQAAANARTAVGAPPGRPGRHRRRIAAGIHRGAPA